MVRRLSATLTGFMIIPFEISYLVFGVLGGRLSDRYGYVQVASAGLLASFLAFLGFSTANPETNMNLIILYEGLFGLGAGLFIAPNTSSIMLAVPLSRRGVASALRTISFNIGFIISLNIAIISMVQYIPYSVASRLIMAESIVSSEDYTIIDLSNALAKAFSIQAFAMAV